MFMCSCGILSYLCLMWCRCTKPACWFKWRRLTTDSRQPREQRSYRKAVCWWTFVSVLHWGCSWGKLQHMWSMYHVVLYHGYFQCNASSDMPHAVCCFMSVTADVYMVSYLTEWRSIAGDSMKDFLSLWWVAATQKDLCFVTACSQ